jgi:hypothetical protein
MQACADRRRESIAIYRLYCCEAYYENCYRLREWLTRLMIDEAKEEFLRNNAWAHQFFSRVG